MRAISFGYFRRKKAKQIAQITLKSAFDSIISCSFCIFPKFNFSKVGNISKIVKFSTDHEFELRFEIFQRLGNVEKKNYVKLQIGMLINGLNRTRISIALVLVQ
jgi:hypothetical protein